MNPQASPSPDASVGTASHVPGGIIGRYRLIRQIGQGGMGAVWLAHDPVLDIDVALKLIQTSVMGSSAAHRLLREARAAAHIKHESVVRVLDYGNSPDGVSYLAMELLEGDSFADLLDQSGPVDVVRMIRMALPLLDALHKAHEAGIIHRDLKPENFFLSRDALGRLYPKILDFGIAQSNLTPGTRLTRAGMVMGTPAFMAPEQVRGETDLDAGTDLWAFTATLYEMLSGHLPFADDDYASLLWGICNQEPASLAGKLGMDPGLWLILKMGFAKDRSERWRSARAYGEALATWLLAQGITEDISGASIRSVWFGLHSFSRPSMPRPSFSLLSETREAPRSTHPAPQIQVPDGSGAVPASSRGLALRPTDEAPSMLPATPRPARPEHASMSQPAMALPSIPPGAVPMRRPWAAVAAGVAALAALAVVPWTMRSTAASTSPEASTVALASPSEADAAPLPAVTLVAPIDPEPTPTVALAPSGRPGQPPASSASTSPASSRVEPARASAPSTDPPKPVATPPRYVSKRNWF